MAARRHVPRIVGTLALSCLALPRLCEGTKAALVRSEAKAAEPRAEPLLSCATLWQEKLHDSPWAAKHREAMQQLCEDPRIQPFAEVLLDKRFVHNYFKIYRGDGFAERAWLTTAGAVSRGGGGGGPAEASSAAAAAVGRLVESVHRLSEVPIVVVSFGGFDLPALDPVLYPRLVVLHANDVRNSGVPYDFNTIQAVLLSRLKVGVLLEPDAVMVNPHADELLKRTKEEISEAYPYPIMPVHDLDRDPENAKLGFSNYRRFSCGKCPKPTMRWGQGQPSWTFWALPFLARWQTARLAGRHVLDVPTSDIHDAEALLNVALWREGASKEWCTWQPGAAPVVWRNYIAQHALGPFHGDPKHFPYGVPAAFYFVRGGSDEGDMSSLVQTLEEMMQSGAQWPKTYYHNMKFYRSFHDLKAESPDVACMM